MRPIKFRAWDMYEKRMVYKKLFDRNWYYTPSNDQGGCHTAYECKTHKEANHSDVMQFTGLLDKNGKEIYEGDIVDRNAPCVIEWSPSGTGWRPFCYTQLRGPDVEVIGNIYENPELLK